MTTRTSARRRLGGGVRTRSVRFTTISATSRSSSGLVPGAVVPTGTTTEAAETVAETETESGTIRTGGMTGTGTGTDVGTDLGAVTGATGGIGGTAGDGADPGRGRLDARRRQGGTRTTRSRRIGAANQSRARPPTSKPTGGVTPSSPPGTNHNNEVDRTGRGGVRVLAACTIDIKKRGRGVSLFGRISRLFNAQTCSTSPPAGFASPPALSSLYLSLSLSSQQQRAPKQSI